MFNMGLVEDQKSHPSLFATLVYCVLLTCCIIPIAKFKTKELELKISIKGEKFLTGMTYVFFIVFIAYTLINIEEIIYILLFGDFAQLRTELINETIGHSVGMAGLFNTILNLFASISFVMILVFFISITYLKKGALFNMCALLGSLTNLLSQIIGISRAGFIYYAILFGICLVIFWRRLGLKIKMATTIPIGVLFLGMGLYFSRVTTDRFEDNYNYGGTQGGLVSYAGMPYSNFCYFFDNKPYTEFSTRFLLPFTNFVLNGYRGGTERELEMTNKTKMNCVVFMTFLGSFIMDCNQAMPFIYVLIFMALMRHCIRNKHGTKLNLFWIILSFVLMTVPAIGCISYFYTSPFKNFCLIVLLGICKLKKI